MYDLLQKNGIAPDNVPLWGAKLGWCKQGARRLSQCPLSLNHNILLPARITEYVVVHEMAHLHEPHHTPAFWLRVERAMPDYAQRKAWLAEHGMDIEGI